VARVVAEAIQIMMPCKEREIGEMALQSILVSAESGDSIRIGYDEAYSFGFAERSRPVGCGDSNQRSLNAAHSIESFVGEFNVTPAAPFNSVEWHDLVAGIELQPGWSAMVASPVAWNVLGQASLPACGVKSVG
jgi:hypothetical protein